MLENGFVKINRSFCKWRWFTDHNTAMLFLYLILQANYEPYDFEKITVQRGQIVTSYPSLAKALNMSVRNVRTALNHLKVTGEVTVKKYAKYSVITVQNYASYQDNRQGNRQSSDSQVTGNRQSSDINERKNKKARKNKKEKEYMRVARTYGFYHHVMLNDEDYAGLLDKYGEALVTEYIKRVDYHVETKGTQYKNYKAVITSWIEKDNPDVTNEKEVIEWG